MQILEPVVRAVGHLSFRSKLRVTAIVFGIPLLVAAGLLVFTLNSRVSELRQERAALSLQLPALSLLGNLHQMLAIRLAEQESGEDLREALDHRRVAAGAALAELDRSFSTSGLQAPGAGDTAVIGRSAALKPLIETADSADLDKAVATLRMEMERNNELSGLLIDGDASSSRLLDIVTAHLPGLMDTAGRSMQIGAVVLAKKSIRGSRRTELTMHRGNFDALVQWSIDGLQKVGRDHPALAASLGDAASRINATYLPVQEAITVKMLDTTDFAMTPLEFIALAERAMQETLSIGGIVVADADGLLSARQSVVESQRNVVVAVMALILAVIVAAFIAAYISIMRGLNGLSDAVATMAEGDLSARAEVVSRDELGDVATQFNRMAESLAQRTAELREKTNDIHTMLHEMEQGILTIVPGGSVHPEYSAYLERIFETSGIAGVPAIRLLFGDANLGANDLDQADTALAACLGEDRMNFDFNGHLLPRQITVQLTGGAAKHLELSWSPICSEDDVVEKMLVVVRDVTELRKLAADAEHQKHELALIGQILRVSQEKFHEFVDGARGFVAENESLLQSASESTPDLIAQLFRNMHTIKGNARTLGFLHLTNIVHEAEQAYDELRKDRSAIYDRAALLDQLHRVGESVGEYEAINDVTLGRKGPGRRGSAEKYHMVARHDVEQMLAGLHAIDLGAAHRETLVAMLEGLRVDLSLIGTEPVREVLAGVLDSLPSLAIELHKEVPAIDIEDHGIRLRTQVTDLVRNVFMHLCRNALDHGIEPGLVRLEAGKPAVGRIALTVQLEEDRVVFTLSDDGRGLALARLRSKGVEQGLIAAGEKASDEVVAQMIFASGFSTAETVTEVSGRGVGMDAVRKFLLREGGDIELRFCSDDAGMDFRAFETRVWLPARNAVRSAPPVLRKVVAAPVVPPRRLATLLPLPGKLVPVK